MSNITMPPDPFWEAEQRKLRNDEEVDQRAKEVIDQIQEKDGRNTWTVSCARSYGWSYLQLWRNGTEVYRIGGIDDMDYYAEKARAWINERANRGNN